MSHKKVSFINFIKGNFVAAMSIKGIFPIDKWDFKSESILADLPALDLDLIKSHQTEQLYKKGSRYLKAGVMLSGIIPDDSVQYNLFDPPAQNNLRSLMNTVDNVNFSMRDDVVKFASAGTKKNWKMRQEMRSPRHTTRWEELYKVH